ncbi:MAG: tRNA uridine-5-carboxymethylaminomethyl(34) synthesis enzyme MnmG, partial [Muribaculaceae bacterium]|nr:tRNA uridine-5-carboxymethylaminomethyl(34) synthesis enzyme MnmG [Muribaculaceae bacterium]
FLPEVKRTLRGRGCFITHTSPEVHQVLHDNLADSPLYNGDIRSIGPRYCPSIETKIVTFADKESHQLFLEPEGETTDEYYINGFSSSLPWQVQLEALRRIPALRNVHFYRPGYAIEYDYFPPTQLSHDLQTRLVAGLYFAGQVNGTTGYEEAAAQGLMAGINAALATKGEMPLVLGRDEAYIGVLIDDLVTKGVDEPYRMFTSRAEYRILLRQDDADMRLTPIGRRVGLVSDHRYEVMMRKREWRDRLMAFLEREKVSPDGAVNALLVEWGTAPLTAGTRMVELLKRPQLDMARLIGGFPRLAREVGRIDADLRDEVVEAAEILVKYEGYIRRERELADKAQRLENVRIPAGFDFERLQSLSTEARQKLSRQRPVTIGMASRIPGVSPADVNILLMMLGR